MNKKISLFQYGHGAMLCLGFLLSPALAHACDICGCGPAGNYIGLLPEFSSKIIGLRYGQNQIQDHLAPDGTTSYLTNRESYRNMEIWGGWTIKERFRLMAQLPFIDMAQENQMQKIRKTGMGDAQLQMYYRPLHTRGAIGKKKNKLLVNDLWVGAGAKLPTGKYASGQAQEEASNLLQLGTGSLDFTLTAMYDLRLQDAGINIVTQYKINTRNADHYFYGNKLTSSTQLYYKFAAHGQLKIVPHVGLAYENSASDLNDGYKVFASGGYLLMGSSGIEVQWKNLAFGGNYRPVLSQRLAHSTMRSGSRVMLHVAWALPK